jgi:signal transduction histidine kinase
MRIKKSYFGTIFSAMLAIILCIILFNTQNYYIQKFHNLDSSMAMENVLNNQLNKMDEYYQKEIEKLNSRREDSFNDLKVVDKNRIKTINKLDFKYKQLVEINRKSIHKFVENMLRYNPYLLEKQIIDEVKSYFNNSFVPLNILIKEATTLVNKGIEVEQDTTKSTLQDGRELNIIFKNEKNSTRIKNNNIAIEKFNIKPYSQNIDNLQFENKLQNNQIKAFISFNNLLFIIATILFFMIIRILFIVRYNRKIEKLFLDNIENEQLIEENYFMKNHYVLGVVKKYNRLITLQGDIMKQSSSLEKRHEQFIADSIHQIKTPLSAIMINLDLIEMSIDTTDIDKFISQMKTSIDMLTLTYEELSYLSMNNSIEYKSVYLNLSETIQSRLDFFKQIALNNDKKIDSTVLSNLYTTINKVEFERIVDNNLINAIKYSKNDSLIEVSLIRADNTTYLLTVVSEGNKIQNSEDIFKRHYREEEGKRGHGLGLAITKEICDKYGIGIEYKREKDKNIFQYTIEVT